MAFKKGEIVLFEVDRSVTDPEFINIKTGSVHGLNETVQVPKLPFQKEPEFQLPEYIACRIIISYNGVVTVKQHLPAIIYELYNDTFRRGESIECTVTYVPLDRMHDKFKVVDSNGLIFSIHDRNAMLQKGQKVSCKFQSLSKVGCIVRFDNDSARLPFYEPKSLAEKLGLSSTLVNFIRELWTSGPDYEYLKSDLDNHNPLWFINKMRLTLSTFPWGLTADTLKYRISEVSQFLSALRAGALYFLEDSDFLEGLAFEARKSMQQQITTLVESVQPYEQFMGLLRNDKLDEFVSSIFAKLEKSGYLYHPDQAFGVMMMIFRLYPHKVSDYLNSIFQSIFTRNLENWEREPFRTAFVEQFEMYLQQAAASIDGLPQAETRSQKEKVLTAVTATALKILLSKPGTDLNRTYSYYYRYISLLSTNRTRNVLNQAIGALFGCTSLTKPLYSQLRDPMYLVAAAATRTISSPLSLIRGNHRFTSGQLELSISPEGMELTRNDSTRDPEQTVPSVLMQWLHPSIMIGGIKGMSGSKIKRMNDHNSWWNDIEHELFRRDEITVQTDRPHYTVKAEPGDVVTIEVNAMLRDDDQGNPRFLCSIIDDDYEDGSGYIDCKDVVGYRVRYLDDTCWHDANGKPLQFRATVADVDDDGRYHFSLLEQAGEYVRDNMDINTEYRAVITNAENITEGHNFSALTLKGFGLFVEADSSFDIRNSDIVNVKLYSVSGGVINGYITEKLDKYADNFTTSDAFRNIFRALSLNGDDDMNMDGDGQMEEEYDELLPDDMQELVEIIRYAAIAEKDLLEAYDYLRLARILALMADDKEKADALSTHAELLLMHDYYATNKRIDLAELSKLEQESLKVPILTSMYRRLEMVAWMGDESYNSALYEIARDPESSELDRTIARMVLSFNMMSDVSDNSDDICSRLRKEIGNALDVVSDTRLGKYYGSESKFIEFKTSIVYPAVARGQKMYPDPMAQQDHILSRIAGFLNAEGGTLFLGVNNEGYAAGLPDDFEYFRTHTLVAGKHQHKITDADKLQVYIDNLLADNFGPTALARISVSVDDDELNREKGRVVIRFDIEKSLEPIYYKDRLYVRLSGQSTKYFTGQAEEEFKRDRRRQLAELEDRSRLHAEALKAEARAETTPEADSLNAASHQTNEPTSDTSASVTPADSTYTSSWRPNVLHDYEDGYSEPSGYLYFDKKGNVEFSPTDLYCEGDCILSLIIPHDMEHANLVMCYENSEPLRIPLAEIYEKGANSKIKYGTRSPLRFAAIADDHEGVLSFVADNSGNVYFRVEPMTEIGQGHINSDGESAVSSTLNHVCGWEIVAEQSMPGMSSALKSSLKRKALGAPLRTNESKPDLMEKMAHIINSCHA